MDGGHQEPPVEQHRLFHQRAALDLDPRRLEPGEALAADPRVRIAVAGHHPRHSGRDHSVGTGGRAAVVAARLEVQVESGAAGVGAGRLERQALGVRLASPPVPPVPPVPAPLPPISLGGLTTTSNSYTTPGRTTSA